MCARVIGVLTLCLGPSLPSVPLGQIHFLCAETLVLGCLVPMLVLAVAWELHLSTLTFRLQLGDYPHFVFCSTSLRQGSRCFNYGWLVVVSGRRCASETLGRDLHFSLFLKIFFSLVFLHELLVLICVAPWYGIQLVNQLRDKWPPYDTESLIQELLLPTQVFKSLFVLCVSL